ncbi:MAG: class I SAM-dependent methyltransferase [Lachnospiraceae bacterium]|nr:class I SAM-dependent methyltransferase [Lachnospiraceae bacterium]
MENKRYGKSVGDIMKIKSDFFNRNGEMLKMSSRQADALLRQPERRFCKICHEKLSGEVLYQSQRMEYFLCGKCGHVNSRYEDTDDFANAVYISDSYENNYSEDDRKKYISRRDMIYIPKAQFLIEELNKDGLALSDIRVLDDGAGSGYFVSALRTLGVSDSTGVEISSAQVDFANAMNGEDILKQADPGDIAALIRNTECNTVTFIGVLEHIINLDEILDAVRDNGNIRYIYFSVPMFSLSCVFEAAHQNCYNRHAGGTHSHLFQDSSISYMAGRIGFEKMSSWKFGSDMMDLYRMICVCLEEGGNGRLKDVFSERFLPILDDLQRTVDESESASEIHMILRRKA